MVLETLVEKVTDEVIAVMVVGAGLYRSAVEPLIPLPEWHVAAIGVVLMYYFGRKIRQGQKQV